MDTYILHAFGKHAVGPLEALVRKRMAARAASLESRKHIGKAVKKMKKRDAPKLIGPYTSGPELLQL